MASPTTTSRPRSDGRDALLALRVSGARDAFVDAAYRHLAAVEDDPQVALELLKTLVEAGLGGPARELLRHRRELSSPPARAAELRRALAPVPTGRVPAAALAERFEANLAALLEGRDHLHALEAALRSALDGHQLFRSSDGALHLSRREEGGLRRWVPSFHDPARGPADLPLSPAGPPVAVAGTGVSELAARVHAATEPAEGPGTVGLFVLDDDLSLVAAWLHAADLVPVLRDPRVMVFAGPEALDRFARFLIENEDVLLPETHLSPPWAAGLGREVIKTTRDLAEARGEAMIDLAGRHRRRGAGRTAAEWARRLRPGSTVLGFASRATTMLQYSMRDIGDAFERLGYRFRMVIERAPHRSHSTLTTSRAVWEADPSLVVLINHFRREQPQSLGEGPLLTWVQDPTEVVLSRETGVSIGPLDFVCGYYQRRCTEELGYPPARFFPAPMAVSTRVFHDTPVDDADAGRYACDLMYVGHLHQTPRELLDHWRSTVSPGLHPLLERLGADVEDRCRRGAHLTHPDEARALTRAAAADLGVEVADEALEQLANYFVYRLNDTIFRRETLAWAARWARRRGRVLRIYGRGWPRDPELAEFAAGPIEHGEPLRRAYRCAALALQTVPSGFKHQRTFEALASGCLVLGRVVEADLRDGAVRFFPELEHVLFRDAGGLDTLAEDLLANTSRRQTLRAAFGAAVHRSFTYEAVVRDVLERIRGVLDDDARGDR